MSTINPDASYSADMISGGSDPGSTEAAGYLSAYGIIRSAFKYSLSGIPAGATITQVEWRAYYLGGEGSPNTIYTYRYGTSHGEDNLETDSDANKYARARGSAQYAAISWPAANNYCSYVDCGATAVADVQYCLDNTIGFWCCGVCEDPETSGGGSNHYDEVSGYDQANKPQLLITYTTPAGFQSAWASGSNSVLQSGL